eukprot:EG_transcript_3392
MWPYLEYVRRRLRIKITFFKIHFLYFVFLTLIGAAIMTWIEDGAVSFIDAFFMTVSSACQCGLTTVDPHDLKVGSMIVCVVMMTMGNTPLLSIVPVALREYYYRQAFKAAKVKDKEVLKQQVEFKALQSVVRITLGIFFSVMAVSFLILVPYSTYVLAGLMKRRNTNPAWFSFVAIWTAWCNVGWTPWSDNVIPLQDDYVVLMLLSTLVMLGNTMYPMALRFVIYMMHRLYPNYKPYKFLLKFPRRCCTHLFTGLHTKMLCICLLVINLGQYAVMMGFESFGSMKDLPIVTRSLICWFQAAVTRSGGFDAIGMNILCPSVQLMMAIMMYISAYPMIAGLRQVSEEKRQYVAMQEIDSEEQDLQNSSIDVKRKTQTFAKEVWSKCMGDVWLLATALFVLTSFEGARIHAGEFSIFSCIFELCSAFGTVGASLGAANSAASLSACFHPVSKLAVIVVLLCGRHRGQPRNIDRAVSLTAMSGEAEIAADPEVKEYMEAVALACSAVQQQQHHSQPVRRNTKQKEAPAVKQIDMAVYDLPKQLPPDAYPPVQPDRAPYDAPSSSSCSGSTTHDLSNEEDGDAVYKHADMKHVLIDIATGEAEAEAEAEAEDPQPDSGPLESHFGYARGGIELVLQSPRVPRISPPAGVAVPEPHPPASVNLITLAD